MNPPAGRQRRARGSLSRPEVLDAAIALVETEGLPALTIRRVAKELNASPMSLYRYVVDRDELLTAMLEETSRALPVDSGLTDPVERLEARMIAAHDFFAEHLWIPHILTRGDLVATSSFGFADACMGDLIEAGLSPRQALFDFGTCWHLMLGELLDRHPQTLGARPTQRERALLEMDVSAYPSYSAVLNNLDPLEGLPPDEFPAGIRMLLAGIFAFERPRTEQSGTDRRGHSHSERGGSEADVS